MFEIEVIFIDFSEDGYARQNRKKSSQEVNLRDVDHAIERYDEVLAHVLRKRPKTQYYTEANGKIIKDTVVTESVVVPLKAKMDDIQKELDPLQREYDELESIKLKDLEPLEKQEIIKEKAELSEKMEPIRNRLKAANDELNAIDSKIGADWLFTQHQKIDTQPTEEDFKRTVANYLSWKISTLMKGTV